MARPSRGARRPGHPGARGGEQIQDAAFDFFSWMDGVFEFTADEPIPDEDILVQMDVESVIMEGCRRIDEWDLIFEHLGSLERVPHLAYRARSRHRGPRRGHPDGGGVARARARGRARPTSTSS